MQKTFEEYLKNSTHFADVVNTHRAATAEALAAIVALLVKNEVVAAPMVRQVLANLHESTGRPSIDTERGLIGARALDALKRDGIL